MPSPIKSKVTDELAPETAVVDIVDLFSIDEIRQLLEEIGRSFVAA
jgi:hypothetical protein